MDSKVLLSESTKAYYKSQRTIVTDWLSDINNAIAFAERNTDYIPTVKDDWVVIVSLKPDTTLGGLQRGKPVVKKSVGRGPRSHTDAGKRSQDEPDKGNEDVLEEDVGMVIKEMMIKRNQTIQMIILKMNQIRATKELPLEIKVITRKPVGFMQSCCFVFVGILSTYK